MPDQVLNDRQKPSTFLNYYTVCEGVAARFPPQADVVFTVFSGNREKILFILLILSKK